MGRRFGGVAGIVLSVLAVASSSSNNMIKGVASENSDERVIGGTVAPEGMFPFIVHLFKNDQPYCGGTLIDSEWVLTAAHCVAGSGSGSGAGSFVTTDPGDFKIGYGTNGGGLESYTTVESIVVNAGFDPVWYTSDIALLKIKATSDLISKTKTIAISNAAVTAGQTTITAGWGQTTNDNTAQASQLMYAGLVTADDGTCSKGASDWNGQNGRYVCTSYSTAPGIGTCYGDSGGPLLLSTGGGYTLLGLVSFDVNNENASNTRCAQDGNVSYFTRVSSYLSFVAGSTGISDSVLVGAASPWSHSNDSVDSSSSADSSSETSPSSGSDSKDTDSSKSSDSKSSDSKNSADNKNDDSDNIGSSDGDSNASDEEDASGGGSGSGNTEYNSHGVTATKSHAAGEVATDSNGNELSALGDDEKGTGDFSGAPRTGRSVTAVGAAVGVAISVVAAFV